MEAVYGRFTVGILLVQDVVAIILMIFDHAPRRRDLVSDAFDCRQPRMFILAIIILMANIFAVFDGQSSQSENCFLFYNFMVFWRGQFGILGRI